jgi:hypothetical protein
MNTQQAMAAAIKLRRLAIEVDEVSLLLNSDASTCECCGTARYVNWPQKQLKERTTGASQRLREIADTLERRQLDPEFLG